MTLKVPKQVPPLELEFDQGWRTRFAPSPSGHLHLGHLVNILYTWGFAHRHQGKVVLRIEDHDLERSQPEYIRSIISDLEWFQLPYETSPPQSQRYLQYQTALEALNQQRLIYPCHCSRALIKKYQNPTSQELHYRGDCANNMVTKESLSPSSETKDNLRIRVSDADIQFRDLLQGQQIQNPKFQCGDFSLRDRRGNFSYQYAVAHDDLVDQIDIVIRGMDIFPSTGRQIFLRSQLDSQAKPIHYLHHPLIIAEDGKKLSKRDFSKSLSEWRSEGVSPQALMSRALQGIGFEVGDEISLEEAFDLIYLK